MEKIELKVNGMSCEGCVKNILNALNKKDKVSNVKVSLEDKKVEVCLDGIEVSVIKDEIENLGFDIIE